MGKTELRNSIAGARTAKATAAHDSRKRILFETFVFLLKFYLFFFFIVQGALQVLGHGILAEIGFTALQSGTGSAEIGFTALLWSTGSAEIGLPLPSSS